MFGTVCIILTLYETEKMHNKLKFVLKNPWTCRQNPPQRFGFSEMIDPRCWPLQGSLCPAVLLYILSSSTWCFFSFQEQFCMKIIVSLKQIRLFKTQKDSFMFKTKELKRVECLCTPDCYCPVISDSSDLKHPAGIRCLHTLYKNNQNH